MFAYDKTRLNNYVYKSCSWNVYKNGVASSNDVLNVNYRKTVVGRITVADLVSYTNLVCSIVDADQRWVIN